MSDGMAALGHRRLAIIDRAGGAQPMSNEDGSCWIVFNGEIYNHHALRERLEQRGHVFRTTSDTESDLHAYEEFGTACVDRLEGMFAFAVYDSRRQEVFIARDRLGKKPLFYATFGRRAALRQRDQGAAPRARRGTRRSISRSSRATCRSATSWRRRRCTGTCASCCPGTGCAPRRSGIEIAQVLGRRAIRRLPGLRQRAVERNRRDLRDRGPRSARERSAARRVPLRRHRLRSRRVVTWPRRSAPA